MIWVLVGVFAIVAVAAAAQAVSGFGSALIATPVVAVLVGPHEAVVGLTMVGIVLVAMLSLRSRGHVDGAIALTISAAVIAGMPIGLLVLQRADDRTLTVIIASVVIVFAVLLWRGLLLPRSRVTDGVAGFVAGTLSTSLPGLIVGSYGGSTGSDGSMQSASVASCSGCCCCPASSLSARHRSRSGRDRAA